MICRSDADEFRRMRLPNGKPPYMSMDVAAAALAMFDEAKRWSYAERLLNSISDGDYGAFVGWIIRSGGSAFSPLGGEMIMLVLLDAAARRPGDRIEEAVESIVGQIEKECGLFAII